MLVNLVIVKGTDRVVLPLSMEINMSASSGMANRMDGAPSLMVELLSFQETNTSVNTLMV